MRIVIVGSGPGGYVAAIKAAQLGAQVTVVEDTEVGGTCLNRGCIPTKTIISSCDVLSKTRELGKFGLELNGSVVPNLAKIIDRKNKVVSIQVKGIRGLFKSWGIGIKEGRGVLTSSRGVEVTLKDGSREKVEVDRIIIATGSRPAEIPVFPFDGKNILSSTDALGLTEIPKSLLVVGAGVIGCEFACIFRELGTEVTMVEMMDRAVATEDFEISELLERELKKKKITLYTEVGVEKAEVRDDGVHAFLSDGREIVCEKLLVAIGRTLNSDNIGLEAAGVQKGKRGEILINEKLETNVPGVYAIGDVRGGMLLAHLASREGLVAATNITGGDDVMDYRVVPAAIFTSPEIASVGLRQHQAEQEGLKIGIGHFEFRALGKAHAMGEISGFIKIIGEERTDRILGAHIIGPHASDLIHEVAVAMRTGRTVADIAGTIHAHPTLSEGIMEAAEDLHGEAVHVPKE
ncbi:Pyruvate dehydrogenase complex E3 subunit D [Candidatus Sulfobium mesophilum]|uniref:Dihydrolipoyl dehydrogenase n=1 Tax=Candidatus Sulfobium mesophilum TaxID=2016548 RepID=A0A2U3QKB9_9BACT|nr:Pyruvate dehydrogenase complex E3 subunit D [Candidatus Sulfobium mesophilum]